MSLFNDHELIFVGTGGGRINSATQYRRTGGIIYTFNGDQAHIDPGPGAIVYLNQMNINRLKTKWVIVTHNHTDHQNDTPIIIESLHKSLNIPAGVLISTENYIKSLDSYYKSLLLNIIPMKPEKEIQLTPNTRINGTKTDHGRMDGFGLIFHQIDLTNPSQFYKIGFTSDTEIYQGFGKVYSNLDILVANVLRPGGKVCHRHACVDEILPELKVAKPKVCIITHFGAMFDNPTSSSDLIKVQMNYIQKTIGTQTKIIGAQDGMRLKIQELIN